MVLLEKTLISKSSTVNCAARNKHEKAFETFWAIFDRLIDDSEEKAKLLDNGGPETPFHEMITEGFACDKFYFLKDLYEKTFGVEGLIRIAERESEGANLLLLRMATRIDNEETLKYFWIFLHEIFNKDSIKRILLKRNDKGNVFLTSVSTNARLPDAIFSVIFPCVLESFSEAEMFEVGLDLFLFFNAHRLKFETFDTFFTCFHSVDSKRSLMTQFFGLRDSAGRNVLQVAAENKDKDVVECLKSNAKFFYVNVD